MAEKKNAAAARKKTSTAVEKSETAEKVIAEQAEVKPGQAAKTFTEEEVQAMIAKAVAQAQAQAAPQVVQIAQNVEKVHFLWQAEVADDNVVMFGDGGMYGRITGKTGSFYVPKSDISRIMDSQTRHFIEKRWLMIVSGLTDEERETIGADYKEGEILDKKAFKQMLELGDEIIPIYRELCDGHKEMVAKRYYEAYKTGKKAPRERIVALKEASGSCEAAALAFKAILEGMNEAEAK